MTVITERVLSEIGTDFTHQKGVHPNWHNLLGKVFNKTFNVHEFGAKCDGTTDDWQAFQDAIDTAEAYSLAHNNCAVTVQAEAGEYRILKWLFLPSNTAIRGRGKFATRLHFDWFTADDTRTGGLHGSAGFGNKGGYTGTSATTTDHDISIEDLALIGNGLGTASVLNGPWPNGVAMGNVERVQLRNLYVYRMPSIGLVVQGGAHVTMEDNLIWEAGRDAMSCDDYPGTVPYTPSHDMTIRNNIVYGCGDDGISFKTSATGVVNLRGIISGNIIYKNLHVGDPGETGTGMGIAGCAYMTLNDNVIYSTSDNGIFITWDGVVRTHHIQLSNNVVINPGAASSNLNPKIGIYILNCDVVTITDSIIKSGPSHGVLVTGCNDVKLNGIVVDGCGTHTTDYGITIVSSSDVTIDNPHVVNCFGGGIHCDSSDVIINSPLVNSNGTLSASGTDMDAAGFVLENGGTVRIHGGKVVDIRGGSAKQTYGLAVKSAIGYLQVFDVDFSGNLTAPLRFNANPIDLDFRGCRGLSFGTYVGNATGYSRNSKAANYAITLEEVVNGDYEILADATAGNVTITLPVVALSKHRIRLRRIDATANVVQFAANGAETIVFPGGTGLPLALPSGAGKNYTSIEVINDKTNWLTLHKDT